MISNFLTARLGPRDDAPASRYGLRILLSLLSIAALAPIASRARAEPATDPPARLTRRALERAGLDPASGQAPTGGSRLRAAALLPRLSLGAALLHRPLLASNRDALEMFAQASWPLGPVELNAVAALAAARQLEARRETVVGRVARLWRQRQQLAKTAAATAGSRAQLEAHLDLEETQAELEALVGLDEDGWEEP